MSKFNNYYWTIFLNNNSCCKNYVTIVVYIIFKNSLFSAFTRVALPHLSGHFSKNINIRIGKNKNPTPIMLYYFYACFQIGHSNIVYTICSTLSLSTITIHHWHLLRNCNRYSILQFFLTNVYKYLNIIITLYARAVRFNYIIYIQFQWLIYH